MSNVLPVRSDRCGLDELFLAFETGGAERARLALGPGWTRQWTAAWQVLGGDTLSLVRDLGPVPVAGCEPVRRFSWRRRQRHRPGLQFMVSTGRVHGFESLEEQSLLLALDFTGAVEDVLPQPFTLRFETAGGGSREHVPDFLAVFRDGSRWLFDVRPARLVKEDDATCFAAAAEAALEAGWRYSVVAGWKPHVLTGLTRCPRSGGTLRTGWACRTACCGRCRRRRPRSGTWSGRRLCRRSPGRMRCTCCGAGGWGPTCPGRSVTRRWSGWPGGTADGEPGRAPGVVGGFGAAAGRQGVDGVVR